MFLKVFVIEKFLKNNQTLPIFTKFTNFYKMYQFLQNVPIFTKCTNFYKMYQLLQNLPIFTKFSIFYKIFQFSIQGPDGNEHLLRDATGVYEIVTVKYPDPLDPEGVLEIEEPALWNGRVVYKQITKPEGTVGYDNYLYYHFPRRRRF